MQQPLFYTNYARLQVGPCLQACPDALSQRVVGPRETRWCSVDEALALASDKGLRRLIARFAQGSAVAGKHATQRAA
jgi:hypothetical protein